MNNENKIFPKYDTPKIPIYIHSTEIKNMKACPCCGNEKILIFQELRKNGSNLWWKIMCYDCGLNVMRQNCDTAKATWNRRA
jgi:predicted RNA-binding Zn-ribbon protein involved in translation (DUF1610 family)